MVKKKHKKLEASVTVESAIVLPVFLLFMIGIICIMSMISTYISVLGYVCHKGKQLACNGYLSSNLGVEDENLLDIGQDILRSLYVTEDLSERSVSIAGEAKGFKCICNDINDDVLEINTYYKYELPTSIFGLNRMRVAYDIKFKKWTGYDISKGENKEELVYITKTGNVYHTSKACTHLKLSTMAIDVSEIKNMRNNSGGKYYECKGCDGKSSDGGVVYITKEGNKYHNSLRCSGLKRSVMSIAISKIGSRKRCNRCNESQ